MNTKTTLFLILFLTVGLSSKSQDLSVPYLIGKDTAYAKVWYHQKVETKTKTFDVSDWKSLSMRCVLVNITWYKGDTTIHVYEPVMDRFIVTIKEGQKKTVYCLPSVDGKPCGQ